MKKIFAFAAAVIAAWLLFLIASTASRREAQYILVANATKADGLSVGSHVRMSGVMVGRVAKIRLRSDYRVELSMRMEGGVPVPEDSTAAIFSDGLLGSKYVEILAGGSREFMADGGVLDYIQPSMDLPSMIGRGVDSLTGKK